jgi:hypothetical protein
MPDQPKLLLKRSALADAGFEDYDVLHNGEDVGRIFKALAAAPDRPWFWGLALWLTTAWCKKKKAPTGPGP